jgi:hypothetical protein
MDKYLGKSTYVYGYEMFYGSVNHFSLKLIPNQEKE